jgi:hypothetical protein
MRVTVLRAVAGFGFAAFIAVSPGAAQDYRMVITNGTNTDIEYFYYSECSANNWLADRLGSNEVIRPGGKRVFDMFDGIRDCCRDMRAKFTNGAARERMNVNVCRESEWYVQ